MDFSKAGEMIKLQQEASKIEKELENTLIESESNGLVITINGKTRVEKSEFETNELIPGLNQEQKEKLQDAITQAINKGIKRSQELAAENMKGIMGKMGMGDMLGAIPGIK